MSVPSIASYLRQSLGFVSVAHAVTTIDCQPSEAGMVVVFVVGQLKVRDRISINANE